MLPHLGNLLLGNIYHALSGRRRCPRGLFERAIANGLTREHLEALAKQAQSRADLPRVMSTVGENHFRRGLYWQDVGVKSRAREHYLQSAFLHMYAALLSTNGGQRAKAFSRCQSSYALAAPQFHNVADLVAIPSSAGLISGYLRLPVPSLENGESGEQYINTNFPCVMLFNSLNSPKEELHYMENAMLSQGIATLSFDYPGHYTQVDGPELFDFDIDEVANSLLAFLASRPEIDISRLAAFGTSIGGRIALYVAAKFPERFRAVASLSAPLDLVTDMQFLLPAMQRALAASNLCSKAALSDLAVRTPLRQLLPTMQTPLLAVGGARDVIAIDEETRTIYEESGSADKKLVICAGAGHNCYEMMPSLRHEIAGWIKQRL